jgi:hypothetical protein
MRVWCVAVMGEERGKRKVDGMRSALLHSPWRSYEGNSDVTYGSEDQSGNMLAYRTSAGDAVVSFFIFRSQVGDVVSDQSRDVQFQ